MDEGVGGGREGWYCWRVGGRKRREIRWRGFGEGFSDDGYALFVLHMSRLLFCFP